MKMKKMVGALALTAALAMGTAPAFAAENINGDNVEFDTDGSTAIKAQVNAELNKQVRASVPLQVTVAFSTTGGGDIVGPTADKYAITNIGEGDIAVTEAEITDMHSTFTSMPIYLDGTDWLDENGDPVTGNAIMFTYKTALNETYLTTSHPLSSAKSTSADKQFVETAKRFTAETLSPNEALNIELAGKHFFNDTLDAGEMTDTLCKIKYTIEAA